jgi:hypothetical protein
MSGALRVSRGELALALGLPNDAFTNLACARKPGAQTRLRDLVEILSYVLPWARTRQAAFAWYRSKPLPAFGDQTAEALLKEGRADAVKSYIDRIAVGGFA